MASWSFGSFEREGFADPRRQQALSASGTELRGRGTTPRRPLPSWTSAGGTDTASRVRPPLRLAAPTSGGTADRRSSAAHADRSRAFEGLRILIADDHALFAEALRALLSAMPDAEVVGYAPNGQEAVKLEAELEPDLLLIDLDMPVMDGVEAIRRIRQRSDDVAILMLTGSEEPSAVSAARAAGANGFLRKDAVPAHLLARVCDVGPRRLQSASASA